MKRVLVMVMVLLVMCVFRAEATDLTNKLTYRQENTSTSAHLVTNVATTTVIAGKHKIMGYRVQPLDGVTASSVTWATIYDGTSGYIYRMLGESESTGYAPHGEEWLFGKELYAGLVIWQGPRTMVEVDYVR